MSKDENSTIEEVKEELKNVVASRFNSPFFGAFLLSWLAWNHRTMLVLLSSLSIDERFHFIDERIYATWWSFLLLNFIGPLASTVAYIFLLPWPTEWVHRWNLYRKRRLREADLISEGRRLLTREEGDSLRTQVEQLKDRLEENRAKLVDEIRKNSAIAMRLLEGMDDNTAQSVVHKYLTSQAFLLENTRRGEAPVIWKFKHNGEVQIPGVNGTTKWRIEDGTVHIIDTELKNDGLGELAFNPNFYCFQGVIIGVGDVRLKGVFQSTDFEL